jgi:hypothetical protein
MLFSTASALTIAHPAHVELGRPAPLACAVLGAIVLRLGITRAAVVPGGVTIRCARAVRTRITVATTHAAGIHLCSALGNTVAPSTRRSVAPTFATGIDLCCATPLLRTIHFARCGAVSLTLATVIYFRGSMHHPSTVGARLPVTCKRKRGGALQTRLAYRRSHFVKFTARVLSPPHTPH